MIDSIIRAVCEHAGISRSELMSHRRKHVRWRHLAWYLAWEHTGQSSVVLGRIFDRDHTSIIYGMAAHEDRISADRMWLGVCLYVEQSLLSGVVEQDAPAQNTVEANAS